ncbi:MAG TPA: hypothetical protein VMJ75_06870 [Candidatus Acidoferrales bacterium]|nr:hypothetical protein [Candidatus Acidoferrales bacterium]HTS66217.1 hypothetical protein [Candidatus Acidoferrales bacterium]
MRSGKGIPAVHQAIATAAVKAILGEKAVIRGMVEVPAGTPFRKRAGALHTGIRTFWSRWMGRHSNKKAGNR